MNEKLWVKVYTIALRAAFRFQCSGTLKQFDHVKADESARWCAEKAVKSLLLSQDHESPPDIPMTIDHWGREHRAKLNRFIDAIKLDNEGPATAIPSLTTSQWEDWLKDFNDTHI